MKTRWVISLIVLGAFILLPQAVLADDLADLKAAHQKILKAVNTADIPGIFEVWQEGAIWIPDSLGFPMVTSKEPGIKMFTKFFEAHVYRATWYKADYRVIGNTGLVWGLVTRVIINKRTGVGKRTFLKTSLVFMKSEGKWGVVMEHNTPIPSAVDIF
jgi:ketosteroid isomerase-like protein